MATASVTNDIVMAWGENGLEPTPRGETVEIAPIPVGPGNLVTPVTQRWLHGLKDREGGIPTRIKRVRRRTNDEGFRYIGVDYECTAFVSYTLDSGPVYGHDGTCAVYSGAHATDAFWDRLTTGERTRIRRALVRLHASTDSAQ